MYIGLFLNVSVYYRRFDDIASPSGSTLAKFLPALIELSLSVLFTFFLMRLISLGGRYFYRLIASLLVLVSVAASYYMTFFNVVMGYGIIAAVMTTDIDLSKEVIGWQFMVWTLRVSAIPLAFIWYDESQDAAELFDPANNFTYVAPAGIEDTYVVFILGETARWDHIRLLGYQRDTTPQLSKERNLVAFRGQSCDTSTKLSMRCMFVREDGGRKQSATHVERTKYFQCVAFTGVHLRTVRDA